MASSAEDRDCFWHEEDGVIYFPIKPYAYHGSSYFYALNENGTSFDEDAEKVLCDDASKWPSIAPVTVAVIRGTRFCRSSHLRHRDCCVSSEKVLEAAKAFIPPDGRGLYRPSSILAGSICRKLTPRDFRELGLSFIAVMHVPIEKRPWSPWQYDHRSFPSSVLCVGNRNNILSRGGDPRHPWNLRGGFAFLVY